MLTIKQINSAVDQRVQIRGRLVIQMPALNSFSSKQTKSPFQFVSFLTNKAKRKKTPSTLLFSKLLFVNLAHEYFKSFI